MYYTVIEDRGYGVVYTGMDSEVKEGLLERAIYTFPQYSNLKIIKMEGKIKKCNLSEPIF